MHVFLVYEILRPHIMECDVTVLCRVTCTSNQPQYLVDYARYETTVKGVLLSFSKFFRMKP